MKKMMIAGLCMMILTVSSLAFAEQVYVTERGKKYHKENCRTIKNREVTAIEEEDAIEQGYEPCGRCFKAKALESKAEKKAIPKKKAKKAKKVKKEKKEKK